MAGQNPYEAPKVDISLGAAEPAPRDLPSAGMGARFLNFLIDLFLSRIVSTIVAVVLIRAVGPGGGTSALAVGIVLGGMLGYYVVLEGAFGWTIGKLITGTRVIRFDGGKPGVGQVIGRSFARFIPFEAFSVLFSSSNQGWHDSLSGTRVVRVRR